ncbi:hypothetical protein [Nocardioides caldifontis]|uniref:hypothetical protein n=1 Tax=Nocardioides caldifontis TaxID=2588938 RepID=UPI0011E05E34|nr:hypothetical protein [Nocardioides caldifontis]
MAALVDPGADRSERKAPPGARRAAQVLTAAGVVAPVVDHGLVRPWLRRWGSTTEERSRVLAGDPEADKAPLFTTTRAVTVRAPAEEVWRWLVQIGRDRGGFYTYDWLENLAGCDLHSADRIHDEWQQRTTDDPVVMSEGHAAPLLEVTAPRAPVIKDWGVYVVEPPHAIMERRMLLGIKKRAERSHAGSEGRRP